MVQFTPPEFGLPSKKYYIDTLTVANYTRTIAQMFHIMKSNKPIDLNLDSKAVDSYLTIARKIVELEARMSRASADKEKANDVTVSN